MSKVGLIAGIVVALVVGVIVVDVMKTGPSKEESSIGVIESDLKRDLKLQDWHEFISPRHDFKVLVPTLPQHAAETFKDKKREAFVSENDVGSLFMINLIVMADQSEKSTDLLNHTVDDFINSIPNNKVLTKKVGSYQGNPSIDFSLENPDVFINGKAFVKDKTLYMLSFAAKKATYSKDEFEFFLNSFQLNPQTLSTATLPQAPTSSTLKK